MKRFGEYLEYMKAQMNPGDARHVIENPLGDAGLLDLFSTLLEGLVLLATPIVIITVIYAGFLFVTSQGNVTKLDTAKRAITYALIGALILLGAEAISALIQGSIESISI